MKALLLLGVLAIAVVMQPRDEPRRDTASMHARAEQARLRTHFDAVIAELRAKEIAHLTASQQSARDDLITWLSEYRDVGRFPLNDRYSEDFTPIFRDARGVTCAMAYLIERSGRRDIVDRVERTTNLAYITELAGDGELLAWLDSAGLEISEAARIQPTYPPKESDVVDKYYARESLLWTAASVGTAGWNLARPGNLGGGIGMIIGVLTVLQSVNLSDGIVVGTRKPHDKTIDTITRLSGVSAFAAGLWAFRRSNKLPNTRVQNGVAIVPILGFPVGSKRVTVGLSGRF